MELELINLELEFSFFNSEIFLLWQSYLEYKLGIPSRYSKYLLQSMSGLDKNGIDRFRIGIDKFDAELSGTEIDPMSAC